MEIKPKDLTIVIITLNRHKFLERTLSYYLNFDYNILIVDGSRKKFDSKLVKNNKVIYIHSISHYYERYLIASRNVKSKYIIVANDDEFFLESALNRCLNFLENNKDYATACGYVTSFFIKYNKIYGYQGFLFWPQKQVLSNNIFNRIKYYIASGCTTQPYNSVMRTKTFKKVGNFLNNYKYKKMIFFVELLINLTIISTGKTKLFKHLMFYRSLENEPISAENWNRKVAIQNSHYWYYKLKKPYKKKLIQSYVKIVFNKSIQKETFDLILDSLEKVSVWWTNTFYSEGSNKKISLFNKLLITLSKSEISKNFLINKILNLISKIGLLQLVYGKSLEKTISLLMSKDIKINTKETNLVNNYLKKYYNID